MATNSGEAPPDEREDARESGGGRAGSEGGAQVACARCGKLGPRLPRPPFRSDLGQRIQEEICAICWGGWLTRQMLLINHFGLNPRDARAKKFLLGQLRAVLFGEGVVREIDTGKAGTIKAPENRASGAPDQRKSQAPSPRTEARP